MKRTWSDKDTRFLIINYPLHGSAFCAEKLGKTNMAVKGKAQTMNLHTGYRLSAGQKEFIRENTHLPYAEIAEALKMKESKVKCFVYRHRLAAKTWVNYTGEETKFIRDNYTRLSWVEIAAEIGKQVEGVRKKARDLRLTRTKEQIREICDRTAGHTRFKKGHVPGNTLYNGAITVRTDSNGNTYKYIRISKGNWAMLHVHNWEKTNGPVPEGKILRSKNGNQIDCDAANWEPIDRATHLELNNGRNTLEDRYIVGLLTHRNEELKPLIAAQPELIELKRNQIKLRRAINECND